jgi:hypothetical protein
VIIFLFGSFIKFGRTGSILFGTATSSNIETPIVLHQTITPRTLPRGGHQDSEVKALALAA